MGNRKSIILVVLLYIFIVSLPFYFLNQMSNRISTHWVDMVNGVMDLTTFDFNDSIAQRGQGLECFPNELLTPEQIENQTGTIFPSLPDIPSLTSRIVVQVPEEREYMIFFISSDFSSKIYVNGNLLDEIGVVGDSYDNTTPQTRFCYYSVYPVDGKIEVVQQSANYYHRESFGHHISIGLPQTVKAYVLNSQLYTTFRMVIFFTIFLIHLGYFMFYPLVRANLYFSLLALLICIREGLTGNKMWATLLPELSWFLLFRAEYLTLPFIATFLLLFLNAFFEHLLPKASFVLMSAWNILFTLIILLTQPLIFTGLLKYYEIGLLVGIVFIVFRMLRTIRHYEVEQYILLAGILVLFYGAIDDFIFYQTPILRTPFLGGGTGTGMMCCIFVQMLALFLRTQRDIHEAKEATQHLELQNSMLDRANRMKTEFLGNISHELKTPLTVIANYAELSRLRTEKSPSADSYIIRNMQLISSETERVSLMVSQLLDISRIEDTDIAWNFSEHDVATLITKTITNYFPVLNKNHNKIEASIAEQLPMIYADEERIIQVLVNLIVNAIRFTKNGTITVGAVLADNEHAVEIYVKDTGTGISEEQLEHLFERFYTNSNDDRHSSGTGLGLYICKSIIESHNGMIHVKSEKNKGTIVTCTIPINNERLLK